ncbi:MAG: dihydroorotase [Phycisphaeraceae bacterium]|nr:dihydroorotase [Phycisphaeraceae bacterium]
MPVPRVRIDHATCVLPDGTRRASLLLSGGPSGGSSGGTILDIDPAPSARADEVIDASGLHLIPGVIDDQVHFREPGLTHKEDLHTASLACARGGVTTFLEMPNTVPHATTQAGVDAKLALAAGKCVVNYGFYIGATPDNIEDLRHATRTPGIKIFIGSSTGSLLVDDQEALERIFAETTLPLTAHCEDEATVRANAERLHGGASVHDHSKIRDHAAARIATARAIDLATRHKHRFHVLHVSTAGELPLIARAQRTHPGLISAEACLHHLWFTVDDYDRLGTRIQMNPSIKTRADVDALWRGLAEGVLGVVATDHAPHTLEEKARPYPKSPSGLPAVENSLALMLTAMHEGRCTLEQIVSWMCTAPARVWRIVNKGAIVPGSDADLALLDLDAAHTVRDAEQWTKCKWSPWDGLTLRGKVVRTIVGGRTVFLDGRADASHRGTRARYAYEGD